ncbi:sigma-54 interaction domain-containing protein [Sphingomonas sp. AX6]|uniref:sigma-54 interaction domain-containing protein n=1 Tax=Sphingomonas sp. AX6 TaxID=2653171 RepID=UPI0012F156A0|nr:sigma 54-interacting transcriptional regulator [Sphingomonas sp. AX6]VXC70448.1 Sigma-54-dependent Fis family transcriptional regulator [Sphingomonas sp. AX6]
MATIHPTAAVRATNYALVSALRSQGMAVGNEGTKPQPGDLFLALDGETTPVPARTVLIGNGDPQILPFGDGAPARVIGGVDDAQLIAGFVGALVRQPYAPVAADPQSLALNALAERVAASDITVLINGPTGTGKEVLARAIHMQSERRDGPFIAINCAALPETMLEAMLFGHQKGSFTGASSGGQGFFRAANGGTLLLDEIAEMPIGLQAKLLRALQEREVVPIGGTLPEKIDVRVIACANRDLQTEVAEGRFRADLYYRLSVFPLSTLSLAERAGDIAALTAAMIVRHGSDRRVLPWIDADALSMLQRHDWPGNVRELENVIQRAMLLARGDMITLADIIFDRPTQHRRPELVAVSDAGERLSNIVQMSEFHAIRETLAACGGSRIETAKRLGISERTLRYRLAKAREQGEDIVQTHSQVVNA